MGGLVKERNCISTEIGLGQDELGFDSEDARCDMIPMRDIYMRMELDT